jgi:hypothetical protein
MAALEACCRGGYSHDPVNRANAAGNVLLRRQLRYEGPSGIDD